MTLYDNAFNLESYILKQFGKALANAEEDAFINGTGVGQPLGLLAANGGAQVGVVTASESEVTADEIIDLIYSLKRPYRKNAAFLTNDKCVAALRKLKDKNGQYLWQPPLQAGEPGTCLGYKIYTSPYFPVPVRLSHSVTFPTTTSVTVALVPLQNSRNSLQATVWSASLPRSAWTASSFCPKRYSFSK